MQFAVGSFKREVPTTVLTSEEGHTRGGCALLRFCVSSEDFRHSFGLVQTRNGQSLHMLKPG